MRGVWVSAFALSVGCTFGSTGGSGSAGVEDTEGATSSADGGTVASATAATMTTGSSMSGATGTSGMDTTDTDPSNPTDPTTMGAVDSSTGAPETTGTTGDGDSGTTAGPGSTWCPDTDGDGAGDPMGCMPADPGGWVDNADDCDDNDPFVALCPDMCGVLGPNISCSGDLESFTDESAEPTCPTSDLTYDVPAGPGEWAIRTADAINSQWYGHGIVDHTSGSGNGRVVYSDLSAPTSGTVYWAETIDVMPNTDYVFELWVKDTATNEPAAQAPRVYLRVDGMVATPPLTLPHLQGDPATYERVAFGWTTDADAQLTIELVNDIDAGPSAGYDVAIDDVVFATCD